MALIACIVVFELLQSNTALKNLGPWVPVLGSPVLGSSGPRVLGSSGPRVLGSSGPWVPGPWVPGPWVPGPWVPGPWVPGPWVPGPWVPGPRVPGPVFIVSRKEAGFCYIANVH